MRKAFTLLAAVAIGATVAIAQDPNAVLPTTITLSPYEEDGMMMAGMNQKIHVEMDAIPNIPVTVMYATGNGFGRGVATKTFEVDSKTFDIDLVKSDWGIPFNEMYILQLSVAFTYGEGTQIKYYENEEGEPIAGSALYYTPCTGAPELVRYYPNDQWNDAYTFEKAYEQNEAKLYYTRKVNQIGNNVGSIHYYDWRGNYLPDVTSIITSYEKGWSEMDGLYVVSFPYAALGLAAEDISRIVMHITGLSAGEDTIVITNPENTISRQGVEKKGGLETDLCVAEGSLNVYNLQGTLVKQNAGDLSGLQPGMYIVNGKKVFVK